jgi:capsular exopolysaccharide family
MKIFNKKSDRAVVTLVKSDHYVSEQYRNVVSSLEFISKNASEAKVIAITSSNKNEGKTTSATNIAVTMAKNGRKILLVDADIRSSNINEIFSIINNRGLTGYLKSDCSLQEVVQSSIVEGLDIITSGAMTINPLALFDSKRFQEFLDEIRKVYDCVIIDTPPINVVVDTKIIVSQVDGVVIVVNENKTKKSDFKELHEHLLIANANILGFIYRSYKYTAGKNYNYNKY